ncbi:hypothetical protein [Vibrio mediterranei]|uniref:DUF3316 domain-containing protein n=1 Tax=Vibrio mediterranei TaxID=689 RepID=A0AAN1FJ67_9VIBR|nr:hypothetical protein [Vibrio mediterranei]ASI91598.1 hypothetical protein BSZ05_17245 [Vibrio mediterranei]
MFKYLLPVLVVFSSGVYAESLQHMSDVNHNKQEMATAMKGIQEVKLSDDVYIVSNTQNGFTITDSVDELSAKYRDTYITAEQAKASNLEKVKTFTVYSEANFENLIKKVESQVSKDAPDFFSVDLYQNSIGDIEITDYVARVVEYK